jgi:chromosome segregation ATPase
MMKNTITTIEGLAALINEIMASKEDIKEFRAEVQQKFELVESRLDRIEHLLLEEQKRKIENLETRMKTLEDALAV